MSLDQRFHLLEPVPSGNLARDRELLARERATGQPVVVHLLAGGQSPENDAVLVRIHHAPPEHRDSVLDFGEYQGFTYVVTRVLPGNPPVRKWIVGISADNPSRTRMDELQRASVHPVRTPEPGEFTRMFQTPEPPKAAPAGDDATKTMAIPAKAAPPEGKPLSEASGEFSGLFRAPGAPKPAAAPPPPAPKTEPGEFTALFQTPGAGKPPAPPPQAPPPPVVAPVPSPRATQDRPQPGEFTRLFHAPAASVPAPQAPPPPPPATPPQKTEPGEFTRMFQSPPAAVPPPPPPLPSQSPLNSAEPGEFTKLFQTPTTSGMPQPATPPPPGDFNRLLDPLAATGSNVYGQGAYRPHQAPQTPPQAPKPAAPPPQGPGDFTRVFSQQGTAPPPSNPFAFPPAGAPPAPVPPVPKGPAPVFGGGDATKLFATPQAPQAPSAPVPAGPSEFTRMFSTPAAPAPPAEPAAPPSVKAPPGPVIASGPPIMVIVILSTLALIAVAVVLWVLLH